MITKKKKNSSLSKKLVEHGPSPFTQMKDERINLFFRVAQIPSQGYIVPDRHELSVSEMSDTQTSSSFTAQHLMAVRHLGGTEQWRLNNRKANVEHLEIDVLNTTAGIIVGMTQ